MGSSLVLSCNSQSFVIELDYGYRYLLEVCSELSDICFLIWLRYYSMVALYDRPALQYSYDCSSVMSVHSEGESSTRDTRVSLASVDMVSRLAKSYWMSTIPTICRGSR